MASCFVYAADTICTVSLDALPAAASYSQLPKQLNCNATLIVYIPRSADALQEKRSYTSTISDIKAIDKQHTH